MSTRWREIRSQTKEEQAVYRRHQATWSFGGRSAEDEITLNSIRLIDPDEPRPPAPTRKEKIQDELMSEVAYTMIGLPPLWLCVGIYLAAAVALGLFISFWAVIGLVVVTLLLAEVLSVQAEGAPSK